MGKVPQMEGWYDNKSEIKESFQAILDQVSFNIKIKLKNTWEKAESKAEDSIFCLQAHHDKEMESVKKGVEQHMVGPWRFRQ